MRSQRRDKPTGRWCCGLLTLTLASLCGCSSLYDDVTSRDFFQNIGKPNDPMTVIKSSGDADRRADALRSLKEPKQNGGNDQQQAEVMDILTKAATTDRHSRCRWAAIQTLGRFKDPNAAKVLETAYEQAAGIAPGSNAITQTGYMPKTGTFQPEATSTLRCQALLSLGETGNPQSIDLLVRVLRQPPIEGTDQERQMTLDEKIAATRALSRFKGDPRVTETLLAVLRDEKDVALRNRATESLQILTGKKLANDFQAWDKELHQQAPAEGAKPAEPAKTTPPKKEKFLGLF